MTESNMAITGGASGIGLALARQLAKQGSRLILADIDADGAENAAAGIRSDGGDAVAMAVDHADEDSIIRLADAAFTRFGQVDMVFANAGIGSGGPIYKSRQENIDWVLAVNLFGPLWLARHFIPRMMAQKTSSRFIITGSEHSLGLPQNGGQISAYTISKHAILGLADTLRRDVADSAVAVSIICPAIVRTPIAANSMRSRHEKFGGPVTLPTGTPPPPLPDGINPEEAARHILAGIDADEFYLFTHYDDIMHVHDGRSQEIYGALERFRHRLDTGQS